MNGLVQFYIVTEIFYKSVDGRAVILKVIIEEIKYVLINVYAPNVQNCQIQFY